MAKFKITAEPKTEGEQYWYAKGITLGCNSRAKEIIDNQARANAQWEEVTMTKTRLKGIVQLTRSLHDLIEAATGGKY